SPLFNLFPYTTLFRSHNVEWLIDISSVAFYSYVISDKSALLTLRRKFAVQLTRLLHLILSNLIFQNQIQKFVYSLLIADFERMRSEEHTSELQSRFDI